METDFVTFDFQQEVCAFQFRSADDRDQFIQAFLMTQAVLLNSSKLQRKLSNNKNVIEEYSISNTSKQILRPTNFREVFTIQIEGSRVLAPGFEFTPKQLQAANTLQKQLNLPKADEHFLLESIAFGQ